MVRARSHGARADLIETRSAQFTTTADRSHSEIGAAFRSPALVASRGKPARIWETEFCGQRLAAAPSRERWTDPPNGRRRPRSIMLTLYILGEISEPWEPPPLTRTSWW
jgi:hypothetical protein